MLTFERTSQTIEQGRPGPSVTTPVEIEVVEAGPDGAVLRWRMDVAASHSESLSEDDLAILAGVLGSIGESVTDYRLMPDGSYDRVADPDAVHRQLLETVDRDAELSGVDERVTGPVRERVAALSDSEVDWWASGDFRLLHTFYGARLDVGEPVVIEDEFISPWLGQPIRAQTATELVAIADDDGCVAVERSTVVETDRIREDLANLALETAGAASAAEAEAAIADMEVALVINVRAQYRFEDGSLQSISSSQETTVDDVLTVERTTLVASTEDEGS